MILSHLNVKKEESHLKTQNISNLEGQAANLGCASVSVPLRCCLLGTLPLWQQSHSLGVCFGTPEELR